MRLPAWDWGHPGAWPFPSSFAEDGALLKDRTKVDRTVPPLRLAWNACELRAAQAVSPIPTLRMSDATPCQPQIAIIGSAGRSKTLANRPSDTQADTRTGATGLCIQDVPN